jgi:hypothetical protein
MSGCPDVVGFPNSKNIRTCCTVWTGAKAVKQAAAPIRISRANIRKFVGNPTSRNLALESKLTTPRKASISNKKTIIPRTMSATAGDFDASSLTVSPPVFNKAE